MCKVVWATGLEPAFPPITSCGLENRDEYAHVVVRVDISRALRQSQYCSSQKHLTPHLEASKC